MSDIPAKTRTVTVRACARCYKDHLDLEFRHFQRPIEDEDGFWQWWASCPNTGDPILLKNEPKYKVGDRVKVNGSINIDDTRELGDLYPYVGIVIDVYPDDTLGIAYKVKEEESVSDLTQYVTEPLLEETNEAIG